MNSKPQSPSNTPSKLAVVIPSRGLTAKQVYMKKWRAEHQEQIKANRRRWYLEHRQDQIDKAVQWAKDHRDIDRAKCKKFRKTHRDWINQYSKKYYLEKERNNPEWVIKSRLRARLRRAIVTSAKSGSAVRDLGCSIEEFRLYLERKFVDGMGWHNWGEWHIDHIKPLASFDLTDREQFLEAVNYTNMQPLWAFDNIRKGAR